MIRSRWAGWKLETPIEVARPESRSHLLDREPLEARPRLRMAEQLRVGLDAQHRVEDAGITQVHLGRADLARLRVRVHYIEGGWPGANPKDNEFFRRAATTRHSLAACCRWCRPAVGW